MIQLNYIQYEMLQTSIQVKSSIFDVILNTWTPFQRIFLDGNYFWIFHSLPSLVWLFIKPINKFNAIKWKTMDSKKFPDIECSNGLKKYCLILYKGFLWKILKNINNAYMLSLSPTSLSLCLFIFIYHC